ncbi:MAG TPA: hypothetical protein VLF79_02875 [Candidatus Saccharimonadales bacterium]|nr:hypothetical protein [Candidatus Saccharimonadales bacterium]
MRVNYNIREGVKKYKTKAAVAVSSLAIALTGVAGSLAFVGTSNASVATVPGPWQLTAPSAINFICGGSPYAHTLNTVTQGSGGNFTGTGSYDPDQSYTWVASGNITGVNVAFSITYTGTAQGTEYHLTGFINPNDGSVSGTVDSNCQSFTMPAGSATQFSGNHGQYVSSQSDKNAAAQSRVGMPVQSKGHTQ